MFAGSNSYQKIGITISGILIYFDTYLSNNKKKYATLIGHAKPTLTFRGEARRFGYPGSVCRGSCRIVRRLQLSMAADKARRGYGKKV
jgi:hypothetical protein